MIILDHRFKSLGCWRDGEKSAIDGYRGYTDLKWCYEGAKRLGYDVFAIQRGGECYTSATAGNTYMKYGRPEKDCCSEDGTGGIRCQEVFRIQ